MATGFKATFTSYAGRDVTEQIYEIAQVPHAPGTVVCRICLAILIATAMAGIDDPSATPTGIKIDIEHLPAFDPTLN